MKAAGKKPTRFDALVAQAAKLLRQACEEKCADDLSLQVYGNGRAPVVELYWQEAEMTGTVGVTGVRLGRKP